ncbi:MAG: CPXCG motif-containing cysteine-rich protein [Exilibacterium sp.]
MNILDEEKIHCPYCGEPIVILIDKSIESQQYVEDCQVCCQPILIVLDIVEGELVRIDVERENG